MQRRHSKTSSSTPPFFSSPVVKRQKRAGVEPKYSRDYPPPFLVDHAKTTLKTSSSSPPFFSSPVVKRQKRAGGEPKYSRDSLAILDAQITDIQNQFEAELENLLRMAGKWGGTKTSKKMSEKSSLLTKKLFSEAAFLLVYILNLGTIFKIT